MEMKNMSDAKKFIGIIAFFLFFYFIPEGAERINMGVTEAVWMMRDYAREHILLCLVPAFFIAGAISVFVSQESVLKYLGAGASVFVAYSVAAVSGTILAVCSCTILPLFAGIYMRGAGLGPAIAFLYSGPAINTLAIILTARILGPEMGIVRALTAIVFSVIIGLAMSFIFRKEETERLSAFDVEDSQEGIPVWKSIVHVGSMVLVLIFANWAAPKTDNAVWRMIYSIKWHAAALFLAVTVLSSMFLFSKDERQAWLGSTKDYALMVTPLLFIGVLTAGFLLGRPGHEALIPSEWIASLVGGNSFAANLFAGLSGALMYFATLTEVPIIQGLMGAGMGKGPALALLLSGPALSLPAILVIQTVLGWKKTLTYAVIMVFLSATAGFLYGTLL
jgi:Predicted permeases